MGDLTQYLEEMQETIREEMGIKNCVLIPSNIVGSEIIVGNDLNLTVDSSKTLYTSRQINFNLRSINNKDGFIYRYEENSRSLTPQNNLLKMAIKNLKKYIENNYIILQNADTLDMGSIRLLYA